MIGRSFNYAMPSEAVTEVIRDVLENPKYGNNVHELSLMAQHGRDPLSTAVWLVEYVANTRGKATLFADSTRYVMCMFSVGSKVCLYQTGRGMSQP